MKRKQGSSLWLYLSSKGVDNTAHPLYAKYKLDFYRQYDKELKRKKRSEKRSYIISYPVHTVMQLRSLAKVSGLTVPEFIKAIVIAEMNETSLDERMPIYINIQKAVEQCRLIIQRIEERDTKRTLFGKSSFDKLRDQLDELHSCIDSIILKR